MCKKKENFTSSCPYKNKHPDVITKEYLNSQDEEGMMGEDGMMMGEEGMMMGEENETHNLQNEKLNTIISKLDSHQMDDENYVKRQNIVKAAQSAANEFCPVSADFDITQYVKKTEIDNLTKCPKVPDMKDFVLKSSIPPASKCPACICPKVKVSSGFCKKCPDPKDICPKPAPCGPEQCKNIVECPKCPAPPKQKPIRCPPPKPCPAPPPCPAPTRCPPNQCPKCKYYGIKTVENKKSIEEMLEDLMLGNDPQKFKKLNSLRNLLGVEVQATPTAASGVATTTALANNNRVTTQQLRTTSASSNNKGNNNSNGNGNGNGNNNGNGNGNGNNNGNRNNNGNNNGNTINNVRKFLSFGKSNNNKNNNNNKSGSKNAPKPSNVDTNIYEPTTQAPAVTDRSYLEPVVDYDNKCVDNSLMYSAVGVLGSKFN